MWLIVDAKSLWFLSDRQYDIMLVKEWNKSNLGNDQHIEFHHEISATTNYRTCHRGHHKNLHKYLMPGKIHIKMTILLQDVCIQHKGKG